MSEEPLVLCMTNTVAASFTANCLLAVGAKPAMMEEPCEAAQLAGAADAALINVGTLTALQASAMRMAVAVLKGRGAPWVLDPVAAHLLDFRREFVKELLSSLPSLVRGNRAEIDGLGISGVASLATGETDVVTGADGRSVEVNGGVPMLQAVTATGCAQGAICAAFLGRGLEPFAAAESASRLMKRAGELAFERAKAPGSFMVALVDRLWELTHA